MRETYIYIYIHKYILLIDWFSIYTPYVYKDLPYIVFNFSVLIKLALSFSLTVVLSAQPPLKECKDGIA